MNSKDIENRFKELNINNQIVCTKSELQEFLLQGLLFENQNKYLDRYCKSVQVTLLKTTCHKLNLDFNPLLQKANEISKKTGKKRFYFITQSSYNKYKEQGRIITKGDYEFYKFYENELWLVQIL